MQCDRPARNMDIIRQFVENYYILIACIVSSIAGLFFIKRVFVNGTPCRCKTKLYNRTVLITGANTGIGKVTAMDLAKRGARVLLACRNVSKAEDVAAEIRKTTGNDNVMVYELDLASLKSVRACAEEVIERESRLDILINNGGLMLAPKWKTKDGFEMHFGTNHLGHFLWTTLLLDLLKKSAPSRIVVVSSRLYKGGKIHLDDINLEKAYRTDRAYAQSKLANVLFSLELTKRLKGTGVTANSLHPGTVQTQLFRHVREYGVFVKTVFDFLAITLGLIFLKTPQQGAQTTIHLAVAEQLENVSGKYFEDCSVKPQPERAQDEEMAAKLWNLSERMVGLAES